VTIAERPAAPGREGPGPYDRLAPGLKLAAQLSPEPEDADLEWVAQMGVDHAVTWTDESRASAAYYRSRRERYARYGITLYSLGNRNVHNQEAIVLGLEGREAKVAQYLQHLRDLGAAGIPYTTYAHMANGIWSSEPERTRGGAPARALNLDSAQARGRTSWQPQRAHTRPLTHGRVYSEDELWHHWERFIKPAARVAEEEGVLIGIHPDDPPGLPELGGVPRLFSTFERYQRALAIADSPNVGVCLCVGCWLEAGDLAGATPEEAIRPFASRGQLFKVHFRNVDRSLPHFVETFIDDGYKDMYPVMRALQEVGFKGVVIPDHVPAMSGDPRPAPTTWSATTWGPSAFSTA
jgi:mannonate dehydratase